MARTDPPLPGWVEEANRRLRARPPSPPSGGPRRLPAVGDLCVAEPIARGGAEPAIVCVVEVDQEEATVLAALASPETDLASDADLLAPAADSGLPFDLMIASDVTGRLWWFQVERWVGRLGKELAEQVRDACRCGPAAAPAGVRGMPEVGSDDPRGEFWAGERARLAALTGDCESTVARGARALPLVVDPRLLADLPAGDARAWAARLQAVVGELATAGRSILPGRAAVAVVEAWDAGHSELDPDLWRALRPCLEGALAAPAATAEPAASFEPPRALGPGWAELALAETCGDLLLGGVRSIRILTMPCAWTDERPGEPTVATARSAGGCALQLIRHHLEVNP